MKIKMVPIKKAKSFEVGEKEGLDCDVAYTWNGKILSSVKSSINEKKPGACKVR